VYNSLPEGLLQEHGEFTLVVEIMYINKIPCMMTMSWAMHFGTTKMIKNEDKINNNQIITKNYKQIPRQRILVNIYLETGNLNASERQCKFKE